MMGGPERRDKSNQEAQGATRRKGARARDAITHAVLTACSAFPNRA